MKMSKQHFELIAQTIEEFSMCREQKQNLAERFADKLSSTNDFFNRVRFIEAATGEER